MSTLKPCPFCGEAPKLFDGDTVWHPFGDCLLEDDYLDLAKWNTRPLEAAVQNAIETTEDEDTARKLFEALRKPFDGGSDNHGS